MGFSTTATYCLERLVGKMTADLLCFDCNVELPSLPLLSTTVLHDKLYIDT